MKKKLYSRNFIRKLLRGNKIFYNNSIQLMKTGGVQQSSNGDEDPHVLTVTVDGIPYNIRRSAYDAKFDLKLYDPEGNPIEMTPELKAKIFEGIADAKNYKGLLDTQSLEYGNKNTAELLPYEPVDNTNIPAVIGRGIGKYSDEFKWRLGNDPGSIALQGKYTMPAIAASALLPLLGKAAATTSIAGIPATTWASTAATAGFAGHGLNHWLNEGINGWGDAAMTALELAPLGRLAKPVYGGVVQPGMRLFNSPLTGNWTTIGNRQYRLNPNSLGANGALLESRSITPQITAENAASITPEQWTAAQDAAIARGDMAEAQRLRDLHSSLTDSATPGKYYRGTQTKRNSYLDRHVDEEVGEMNGIYLTKKPKYAKTYGDVEEFYLRSNNPLETEGSWTGVIDDATRAEIENAGYDAVVNNRFDTGFLNKLLRNSRDETITFNGKNLKLADAVTYDDNGIRIPLGERDNFKLNDIRYGLLPFLGLGATGALYNKQK